MAKAQTGVAGPVVAELAYRNESIAVGGQRKFADQVWRKNKCHASPPRRPWWERHGGAAGPCGEGRAGREMRNGTARVAVEFGQRGLLAISGSSRCGLLPPCSSSSADKSVRASADTPLSLHKSTRRANYRKPFKPLGEKYSGFPPDPNHLTIRRCPAPPRGVCDRHGRGAGCGGREERSRRERFCCGRRSRVVLMPRRWRQVRGKDPRVTVAKKPVTGESTI